MIKEPNKEDRVECSICGWWGRWDETNELGVYPKSTFYPWDVLIYYDCPRCNKTIDLLYKKDEKD